MEDTVGGVDEAGRGCLAGPLVVAGVSVSKAGAAALRELGVRDSKTLTPKRREALYKEVRRVCDKVRWVGIPPAEIDSVVFAGRRYRRLNHLEAVYFAKVIDSLGADLVTVDAADTLPSRFRAVIVENMEKRCKVVASHKADRDDVVVGAASIVAKVQRDRAVERLRAEYGDFGSGYPSDPDTRAFFSNLVGRGESLPDYVRKSWKTWGSLGPSAPGRVS